MFSELLEIVSTVSLWTRKLWVWILASEYFFYLFFYFSRKHIKSFDFLRQANDVLKRLGVLGISSTVKFFNYLEFGFIIFFFSNKVQLPRLSHYWWLFLSSLSHSLSPLFSPWHSLFIFLTALQRSVLEIRRRDQSSQSSSGNIQYPAHQYCLRLWLVITCDPLLRFLLQSKSLQSPKR